MPSFFISNGQDSARQFILFRKKQGKSWPTINCIYSALRKYFKNVLRIERSLKKIPRPRQEDSLPIIISKQDVVRLINQAGNYKQIAELISELHWINRLETCSAITESAIYKNTSQIIRP